MTEPTTPSVERPGPPPLEYQYPLCPMCGEEVDHDGDGWVCPRCAANWSSGPGSEGDTGSWNEDDEPQCVSSARHRDDGTDVEPIRCMRGENHVDDEDEEVRAHRGPSRQMWPNYWMPVVTGPAPRVERDARTNAREAAWRAILGQPASQSGGSR